MKQPDVIVIDDLQNWKMAAEASGCQFTRREERLSGGILCVEHVAYDGHLRQCGEHLAFPEHRCIPAGYMMRVS